MRYRIHELLDHRTGAGIATEALSKLGDEGQANFDDRVIYLRDQPPPMWRDPYAKRLSAENDPQCKDIYEIRFKAQRVQQRPLGYFGPEPDIFTIVLWVTHKGKQWIPREYCRIARERWAKVRNGELHAREVEID